MWRAAAYLCLLLAASADSRRLDDYIRHFEELNYDRQTLGTRHDRVKRSTNDKNLHLEFTAFGRHFQLHLQPDTEGFTPDAVIEVDGKSEPLDTSHIYRGELYGDPSSPVHGSVIQGRFLGTIKHSDSGSYWVEAAEKYFQKPSFHSVIYKEEDVEDRKFFDDLRKRREATSSKGGCGNSDPRVSEWMRTVQNSTVPASEGVRDPNLEESSGADEHGAFKYTRRGQEVHGGKRAPRQAAGNQKTCTLFLQSDPELWRYYNETFYSKAATADQVKQQISALFSSHVSEVNGIYTTTTFKDTTGTSPKLYGGYNFRVDRILINTTEPCDDNIASNDSPYCNRAIDASNLLNLNSYRNHDGYCLAFIFTYRDFSGGTLGLAWVADPGPSKGGVCTKWSRYSDDSSGTYVYKSLNTGIVTIVNYGKLVPPKVSVITFAHEIGHNFGSPHDNPDTNPDCAPLSASKSSQGNYIMFASATSGDMPNNNRFSSCSMQKIGAVLTSVTQGLNGHYNCFQASQQAFCGNAIREEKEQCDCGYQADCLPRDRDCCRCCVGASDSTTTGTCMLRSSAVCDPSAGPCCKSSCSYYSVADRVICKPATECQGQSMCIGNSSSCPSPVPKANLTSCNQNTQVCINGECAYSICLKINWVDCEPPLPSDGSTDSLCYISCRDPVVNGTCWSSSRVGETGFPAAFKTLLSNINGGQPIALSPGRACNSYQGYCDVFQKCRQVDADGPLARLKNLLFNPSTLATVKNWIEVYWWAVALMVLGLILLMAAFIKLCAVHTPSNNPNQPKARRLSETLTLRRRRQDAASAAAGGQRAGPRPAGRSVEPVAGSSGAAASGAPPPYTGLAGSRPVHGAKGKEKHERYEMS